MGAAPVVRRRDVDAVREDLTGGLEEVMPLEVTRALLVRIDARARGDGDRLGGSELRCRVESAELDHACVHETHAIDRIQDVRAELREALRFVLQLRGEGVEPRADVQGKAGRSETSCSTPDFDDELVIAGRDAREVELEPW